MFIAVSPPPVYCSMKVVLICLRLCKSGRRASTKSMCEGRMKIVRYEAIPLKDLSIGESQSRVRDVNKGIEDLAQSIKKIGLLEPIVVAPPPCGE